MEQTRQAGAGRGLPPLCTMPSPGTRGQGLQASPSRWGIGGMLLEGPFRGRLRDWTELRGSRGRPLVTSDGWRCPGAGLCSALFPARVLFVQGPTSQLAWRRRRSGGSRSLLARAGLSQGSSLKHPPPSVRPRSGRVPVTLPVPRVNGHEALSPSQWHKGSSQAQESDHNPPSCQPAPAPQTLGLELAAPGGQCG